MTAEQRKAEAISGGTAYVAALPLCDFPHEHEQRAQYDARTPSGVWGYWCTGCFDSLGVGLGVGSGQYLIVGERPRMSNMPDEVLEAAQALGLHDEELMELEEMFG